MLRIFTPVKIQRLQPGLNPRTWVPEASMLTTRPPKPSFPINKYRTTLPADQLPPLSWYCTDHSQFSQALFFVKWGWVLSWLLPFHIPFLIDCLQIFGENDLADLFMERVKVKDSCNSPGVAQRVPGGLDFQISWHSAHEGGEVVSLTHRPPLPPGNVPGTHFHQGLSRPQGHGAVGRNLSLKI